MRYEIVDHKFHFVSGFDTDTGTYVRTGILDAQGRDTGHDPFMASFPHLIDVGVMGHCIHGKNRIMRQSRYWLLPERYAGGAAQYASGGFPLDRPAVQRPLQPAGFGRAGRPGPARAFCRSTTRFLCGIRTSKQPGTAHPLRPFVAECKRPARIVTRRNCAWAAAR